MGDDVQNDHEAIDAVITWVDGNAPGHRELRQSYMSSAQTPLHENAINPHRWTNNDEILFCLQSIENNAPWLRNIWIVLAEGRPDLSRLSEAARAKIKFAYHSEVFDGFEECLPTFNSLAIETMLWRIDGLSDRFLYFNDDVFITAPLEPGDVFQGDMPVLRGRWVNYSDMLNVPELRDDPAKFNHFMQINAAQIAGYQAEHLFSVAHVVHPFLRSKISALFTQHREIFRANIQHRFRDLSQFLPQGLHNHACLAVGQAIINTCPDHLHIISGQGKGQPVHETLGKLEKALDPKIRFLCVNDLPQLEEIVPQAREIIGQAIGGFGSEEPGIR